MEYFCILTGYNYFSRAIALYNSLCRHLEEFTLYYFTFDEKTYSVITTINYKNIIPIPLCKLETSDLLKVKKERTIPEYYYTLTPYTILYVLKTFKVDVCTYLDADIYFFNSPKVLLDQLKGHSAIITEHRHSKQEVQPDTGRFCVQFMPFRNDTEGVMILEWWAARCKDWCYLRRENGLWADQGYLEDWPERFTSVHVLSYQGEGLAPWNIKDFKISEENSIIYCTDIFSRNKCEVIYYHYQGLKLFTDGTVAVQGSRYFDKSVLKHIYSFYVNELIIVKKELEKNNIFDDPHGLITPKNIWILLIKNIYRTFHPKRLKPFKIDKFILLWQK